MPTATNNRLRTAVRTMALFEAAKGVAVLLGLAGLLRLMHHDLHRLALELIGHFGRSPTDHYPALLVQAVDKLNATPVHTLVLLGGAYALVRFVEAWGLWQDRAWGEWCGVAASGLYIPVEIRHIWLHPHWQGVAVLLFNIALVIVLLLRLRLRLQA